MSSRETISAWSTTAGRRSRILRMICIAALRRDVVALLHETVSG